MAVNLITVTGNLETLTGATPALGRLWFKLSRPDWNLSGDIFAPEYIEAIANPATGLFTVALQTTVGLATGATYSAVLRYQEPLDSKPREYTLGVFALPTGGPYQLGDLLAVPITTPVPADILALCQAYAVSAGLSATSATASASSATASAAAAAASAAAIDLGALNAAVLAADASADAAALSEANVLASATSTASAAAAAAVITATATATDAAIDAEAARDAALLSRGIFATTAAGLSKGVVNIASLVGGSAGANGTFALAFSGGAGVDAAGVFVVAGGAVTQVTITNAGTGYTSAPTISFAASAGLTGASATAVIGFRSPVGTYFSTPSTTPDVLILYRVDSGPVAVEVGRYPSSDVVTAITNKLPALVPDAAQVRLFTDQSAMDYAQDFAHRSLKSAGPEIIGLTPSYSHGQTILVQSANAQVDLSCMDSGNSYQFYCNGSGGTSTRFEERVTDDLTVAPVFYLATAGTRVTITKLDTNAGTVFFKDVHSGSYTIDASQVDRARGGGSVILGGQSLCARAMRGATTQSFVTEMNAAGYSTSWRFLNVAAPGSSMFYANDASGGKTNHWWDERTDIPGPLAIAARDQLNAFIAAKPAGEALPSSMMWNIGQNDFNNIEDTGTTTMVTVRAHHRSLFAWLRTQCSLPSLVVFIEMLGSIDETVDPYGTPTDNRATMYRRAQLQTCLQDDGTTPDPLIKQGAETFDLPRRRMDVHLSMDGQDKQGQRWADLVADHILGRVIKVNQGCYITSHTFLAGDGTHRIQFDATSSNGFIFPFGAPDCIQLFANAKPTVSDTPLPVKSYTWVATAQPDRYRLDIVLESRLDTAKAVLNPGMGTAESARGNWLRDAFHFRGLRSMDERPWT